MNRSKRFGRGAAHEPSCGDHIFISCLMSCFASHCLVSPDGGHEVPTRPEVLSHEIPSASRRTPSRCHSSPDPITCEMAHLLRQVPERDPRSKKGRSCSPETVTRMGISRQSRGGAASPTERLSPKLPPGSLRVYASEGTVAASVSEIGGKLHGVVAL